MALFGDIRHFYSGSDLRLPPSVWTQNYTRQDITRERGRIGDGEFVQNRSWKQRLSELQAVPFIASPSMAALSHRFTSTATSCDRCGAKGNTERDTTWLRTHAQLATMPSPPVTKTSSQTIYYLALELPVIKTVILFVSAKNCITKAHSLYRQRNI